MKIKIIYPGHTNYGHIVEAQKTKHGYEFVAVRPDDPDDPRSEDRRRYFQCIRYAWAEEIS